AGRVCSGGTLRRRVERPCDETSWRGSSMKSVRRTFTAIVLLVLLGAGGAGAYVVWIWNRSDELLARTMREKLAEIAPDWNISFRRAWSDIRARRLSDEA